MKTKKALLPVACLLVGISIGTHAQQTPTPEASNGKFDTSQVEFYDSMILNASQIKIYDTSELNHEIMANRNGKIIVEKIIGEVTDHNLNGKILNCDTNNGGYTNKDGGNYINYERVDGAKEGDRILTYFIYNPFTNTQDDVLTRLDFIIDCNTI